MEAQMLQYQVKKKHVLSEENNQCNVIKFLFLSIIFNVKLKKKTSSVQKSNNFVLTLNLIFNMLTLKVWFSEINLYLVIPRQIIPLKIMTY